MTPPIPDPDAGLNAAVASELRAEMARQKISVKQLAQLSDIPYGTLRRYLNAERHIDVAVLEQLVVALQVTAVAVVTAAQARAGTSARESALDEFFAEQRQETDEEDDVG